MADLAAEASQQRRRELVRHRTAELQALEAGRQAKRLRLTDLDHKVPVSGHLIQHHALEEVLRQRRSEADDLGDPHLDEADIGSREHVGRPFALSAMLWPAANRVTGSATTTIRCNADAGLTPTTRCHRHRVVGVNPASALHRIVVVAEPVTRLAAGHSMAERAKGRPTCSRLPISASSRCGSPRSSASDRRWRRTSSSAWCWMRCPETGTL